MFKNMSELLVSTTQYSPKKSPQKTQQRPRHIKNPSCPTKQQKVPQLLRNLSIKKNYSMNYSPVKVRETQPPDSLTIDHEENINERAIDIYEQNQMLREKIAEGLTGLAVSFFKTGEEEQVFSPVPVTANKSVSRSRIFVKPTNISRQKIASNKSLINLSTARKTDKFVPLHSQPLTSSSMQLSSLRAFGNNAKATQNTNLNKNVKSIVDKLTNLSKGINYRHQELTKQSSNIKGMIKNMRSLWRTDQQIQQSNPQVIRVQANLQTLEQLRQRRLKLDKLKALDQSYVNFDPQQKIF